MKLKHDQKYKICFFESSPPFGERLGGIPTYILHRAHILTKNNFTVYWTDGFKVAVFEKNTKQWEIVKEFKTNKLKKRIIVRFPKLQPGIKYLLNEIKIDIIEFPDSYGYNIKPLKKKCKVIFQCHTSSPVREFLNDLNPGFRSKLNAIRIKNNLLNADKIIACSYEIALLTSGFYKLNLDKFNIIHHAFDKDLFYLNSKNSKRDNYFITVANVEYFKGTDLLLKAFIEYKKLGGRNKLLYIGPKDLYDVPHPMDKKWRQLGTDKLFSQLSKDDFKFIPYLKKEEVFDLINKSAATIVMSRFEAFTMVIGEAASAGCPLIVSNRLGWNNLINKFNAGLLVNPYDENEVAKAMLYLERDDIQYFYSENIKKLFNYLSSKELTDKTLRVYNFE